MSSLKKDIININRIDAKKNYKNNSDKATRGKTKTNKTKLKIKNIKAKQQKGIKSSETKSENKLRLALYSKKHSKIKECMILPEIPALSWNNFISEIKGTEINENKNIQKCIDKMHGYRMYSLHFTTLYYLHKAIVDSLLQRKWDNLLKLVLMLIKNYSKPVFTIFIGHMCNILKHNHPRIRGTELEDQINLIEEKYGNKRNNQIANIV